MKATTEQVKFDHELKTWPKYFEAIRTGSKKFEVRKNDRGFKENDTVLLREWNPATNDYTGRIISATISYVLPGGQFGIEADYCVLSLVMSVTSLNEIVTEETVHRIRKAAEAPANNARKVDWKALHTAWNQWLDRMYS